MSKINKIRLSGTDYDIQDVSATSVVEVTQQQYDDLPASAKTDNILYIITDSTVDYVTSAQTQSAITQAVSGKVDTSTYAAYTAATDTALANKQTTLTAGTGIAITNNVISTTGGGNSVVELTQAAYDALVTGGTVDPDTFYIITDATPADMSQYWTSAQTQSAITQAVSDKADADSVYTKTETDNAITAATTTKQDTLVSSQNIKTINNESILGSGNIDIQGGGKAVSGGTNISITTGETADTINCTLSGGTLINISNSKINCTAPIRYGTGNGGVIVGLSTNTNKASGRNSIANGGNENTASGQYSYAEGFTTQATKHSSHSEGFFTIASGNYSHTEGNNTKTTNESEHASGKYNVSNKANDTFGNSGNTLFSVGNGTADNARHNAFEIRQNGDIYCSDGTNDVKLQDTITATAANTTALGGLKLVKLTQSAYDALAPNYDSNTLYVING